VLYSIAAKSRAPFARLIFPGESNPSEDLSARIARFSDIHAMLCQQLATLLLGQLHGEAPIVSIRRL
jgi:hypothetical protein